MNTIVDTLRHIAATLADCAVSDAQVRRHGTVDAPRPRGRRSHQVRSARARAAIRAVQRSYTPSRSLTLQHYERRLARCCNGLAISEDARPGRVLLSDVLRLERTTFRDVLC